MSGEGGPLRSPWSLSLYLHPRASFVARDQHDSAYDAQSNQYIEHELWRAEGQKRHPTEHITRYRAVYNRHRRCAEVRQLDNAGGTDAHIIGNGVAGRIERQVGHVARSEERRVGK